MRDLTAVARSETLLLARSLQTAFENALRDHQIEDVFETLEALAGIEPAVSIFVFDENGRLVGSTGGVPVSAECTRIQRVLRGKHDAVVEFSPRSSPEVLRVGLRLTDLDIKPKPILVLERPLHELRRDVRYTRRFIVTTATLFVGVVAALAWLTARRYVAIPLQRMVADMRRVRGGHFCIEREVLPHDEVGAAQREFSLLIRDLDTARARAEHELEMRRRIERGLEQADKLITLGQLSAVMAHEIGSPIQVLEGRARALSKHADDAEAVRRTAALLIEQVGRINRIVTQMLSITRRRRLARVRVSAEELVHRIADLLEVEARRCAVSIQVESRGPTEVFADVDQLQQIILNLMRNALDAAPPNSVITCSLEGDSRELVIDIADEGPGFDPRIRPHLGEPFATTKAGSGGSGLGLSVVKSILADHDGGLEFSSDEEAGGRVRVRLPRGFLGAEE